MQEFLLLASQRMVRLRDMINCPADRNLGAVGLAVKGAFFYIEGTFYVDKRAGANASYARPIISFCRAHGLAAPPEAPEDAAEALPQVRKRADGRISMWAGRNSHFPPSTQF